MRNRQDNELIPKDVSVAAVAWDNIDMKPTMNLVGQDYVYAPHAASAAETRRRGYAPN